MRIGFLGGGNMGGALIDGLIKAGRLSDVLAFDTYAPACEKLMAKGVTVSASAQELCAQSDAVVLAVKPQVLKSALTPCAKALGGKFVISIAAGWSVAKLAALLPRNAHILRVMPNTPALVGCGMAALCENPALTDDERAAAEALFGAVGEYIWVDEAAIDAVTGVSGSGAAYVYMVIDAMALGGVRMGLKRDVALKLAAQTVKGAAELVLQSGDHPDALRDAVCSPAGTTIEAVRLLEQRGVRSAFMDAVIACAEKSGSLNS